MKTFAKLLILTLILFGCACQVSQTSTGRQPIEQACVSASAAVKTLTVADRAGKLSASQESAVLHAIDLTDPVCHGSAVPDNSSAFRAAVLALEVAATGVKQNAP